MKILTQLGAQRQKAQCVKDIHCLSDTVMSRNSGGLEKLFGI